MSLIQICCLMNWFSPLWWLNLHYVSSLRYFSLQPLSAANEYHVQGERAGLSTGDIHFACMNRLIYSVNTYWLGHDLSATKRILSDACQFMKDHENKNSLQYILIFQSTVMMLVDSDTEIQRRNELLTSLQECKIPRVQMTMYVPLYLMLNKT